MSSQSSIGDSDKENNTPTTSRIQDLQKSKKRVLFSPLPALLQPSVESKPDHLKLPQRSVLKVGTNSSSPFSSPIYEKEDPARSSLDYMIESAIQSLSGNDRPSKIETYATLSNLFRTFENIPDRTKLFPRLPELFGLIVADVVRTSEDDLALPDYPLNTKALKIAGFLLFDRDLSGAVPARLSKTLMEHSLKRMEADKVTKATSTQFLWLWQTQHLPRAIITADIAERMLHATVEAEFPSLIINQERMSVFLRLLDQSRETMVKNIELWLPRVINYLLDDNKQIRTAALRTALEAGRTLCRVPSVGRCVQNHLRSEVNGLAYIEVSSERFKKIMQEPEGGIYVAHAWGAICTLSSSQNPEKSKSLMAWMHVLQIVFNSSATENKIMAQSAWVRMIHYFGNNGDIIYREKNLAYLTKPICRMLSTDVKVYDTVRMAAVNTASSLLYAVNKPGVSAEQTSVVWNEVVKPVTTSLLQDFQKEPLQQRAVDLLAALFEFKALDPWALSRLLEDKIVQNKDINHFDTRWVRAHINEIAPIIVLALQSSASEESKLNLWAILQKSLRHASAKEVQISAESMEATATICTVFKSLWTAPLPKIGSPSNKPQEDISRRVSFVTALILSTFEVLGTSSFTEKTLSFVDGGDVVPAQTPSMSQASKVGHGTGLTFVYKLFQNPAHEVMVDGSYIDMLESITTRCLSGQKSVRKCMNLLAQCMSVIELEKSKLPVQSWKILAEVAQVQIQLETDKFVLQSPSRLKHIELDQAWVNARSILETGLRLQYGPAFPEWQQLTEVLVKIVRNQMGAHGANIHVLQPLSCLLLEIECSQFEYVQTLVKSIKAEPQDIKPQSATAGTDGLLDLDEVPSLAELVAVSLVTLEAKWKRYQLSEEPLSYLSSIAEFVDQVHPSQVDRLIKMISKGVGKWLARIHEGAEQLIRAVLRSIRRCGTIEAPFLESCSPIFIACWTSGHSEVRGEAVETWNQTFGKLSRLEYSADFITMVKRAEMPIGTLTLPTWPEQDPEIDQTAESSTTIVIDPPKMNSLNTATSTTGARARSRTRSISRSGSQARRSSRGIASEEHVSPIKSVLKKRKRRDTGSKTTSNDGGSPEARPIEIDHPHPIDVVQDTVVDDALTPTRKRQKRNDKQSTRQSPGRRERRATRASVSQEDDVFGPKDSNMFLLSKRTLRATSPQLGSDQLSEISPSVASRVRKLSSSAEPPVMQDLRPLTSSIDEDLVVLQDEMDDEFDRQDRPVKQEDELNVHARPARPPNSDDLMQIQIHDHASEQVAAPLDTIETLQESIDEDLFILQLQQYRESLKQGRPITPRRRKTLGILMQEITKLSRDVTDMYFSP